MAPSYHLPASIRYEQAHFGRTDIHTLISCTLFVYGFPSFPLWSGTQNDYKNLCLEIEKLMFNMHAVAKEAEAKGHTIPTRNTGASTSTSTASNLDSSSISSSESIEKKHADRTVATSSTTTSSSFSSSPKSSSSSTSTSTSSSTSQQLPEDNSPPLPIFTVRTVLSGSPAAAAGLQPGDAILAFGPVSRASVAAAHARDPSLSFAQTATRSVGLAVRESVGVPMRILIARQTTTSPASERPVEVSLTPQTWSGTGLLGCEVVPVAGI